MLIGGFVSERGSDREVSMLVGPVSAALYRTWRSRDCHTN